MLYLIGLGLNLKSISKESLEVLSNCDKVYLENYTVDFPYSLEELKKELGVEIESADRNKVESSEIPEESKNSNVALLVYGSPLVATTHLSLIEEAKELGIDSKILHNASIFDAVSETGLQIYKFGKTTSMPRWKKSYQPDSFMKIVRENSFNGSHSLILCDIGMTFKESLDQLVLSAESNGLEIRNLVVCQSLGTEKQKIFYGDLNELESKEVGNPFCIIVPGELNFKEKEFLENNYS